MKKFPVLILAVLISLTAVYALNFWHSSDKTIFSPNEIRFGGYFESGDGNEEFPYEIARPSQFRNLARLTSIGYLSGPYHYYISDKYITEENPSIDMSGYLLPPIGSKEYPFYGHLTSELTEDDRPILVPITNLVIASGNGSTEYDDIGIFGYIAAGATVENMIFDDPVISSRHYAEYGYLDYAAIPSYTGVPLGSELNITSLTVGGDSSDVYFTFGSSDKNIISFIGNNCFTREGTNGEVVLRVLANTDIKSGEFTGIVLSKMVAEYLVTVTNGVMTGILKIDDNNALDHNLDVPTHPGEKHIGLFAGHISGGAKNISVYGGQIDTELTHHISELGLIGYVNEDLVNLGNINGARPVASADGDTGYLYLGGKTQSGLDGGLNYQIGKPLPSHPDYTDAYETIPYLTQNANGFARGNSTTGWQLNYSNDSSGRILGGFGIFELVTSKNNIVSGTQIEKLKSGTTEISISSVAYRGLYSCTYTQQTYRQTLVTDDPNYPNVVNASTPIPMDLTQNYTRGTPMYYLRTQIVDPYAAGDQRIRSFHCGLYFNYQLDNNNVLNYVHPYTGIMDNSRNKVAISNSMNFDVSRDESNQRKLPIDIIIIAYAPSGSTSNIHISTTSTNVNAMNRLFTIQLPQGGASCYVVRMFVDAGTNSYAIHTGLNNGKSEARILYLAVGGQKGGVTEKTGGELRAIDFVYRDANGKIVHVSADGYRFSEITFHIDFNNTGGSYTKSAMYFRRTAYNVFYIHYTPAALPIVQSGTDFGKGSLIETWPFPDTS